MIFIAKITQRKNIMRKCDSRKKWFKKHLNFYLPFKTRYTVKSASADFFVASFLFEVAYIFTYINLIQDFTYTLSLQIFET